MNKADLEHIIRAASAITNQYEIIIVGSQSVLGSVDRPPPECLLSMEADVFVYGHENLSDLIDGAIGEGSKFHENFGYYAQGVDSTTSVLPSGWHDRLVRLQSANTDLKIGLCLDVTDLFLAKCAANREKDIVFNVELLSHRLVDVSEAISRVATMPLNEEDKQRMGKIIEKAENAAVVKRHQLENPGQIPGMGLVKLLQADNKDTKPGAAHKPG